MEELLKSIKNKDEVRALALIESNIITKLIDYEECITWALEGNMTNAVLKLMELDIPKKDLILPDIMEIALDSKNEIITMKLIEKGVLYSARKSQTVLNSAINNSWPHVVIALLDAKIDVNADTTNPALIEACKIGNEEIATILLDAKADIFARDRNYSTALSYALMNGMYEISIHLHVSGLKIANFDDSELGLALFRNQEDKALEILENESRSDYGRIVYSAFKRGMTKLIQKLMDSDIDCKHQMLFYAISFGYEEIAAKLVDIVPTVNILGDRDKTVFALACERKYTAIAIQMINRGLNLEYESEESFSFKTPLMIACENGLSEVATLLIERGANVKFRNNRGWSILQAAVHSNLINVVSLLLETMSCDDLTDDLVGMSINNKSLEMMKLLLEKGIGEKFNLETEFCTAINERYEDMAILLFENCSKWGKQILVRACGKNLWKIAQMLFKVETDMNSKRKAFWQAVIKEKKDIALIFIEYGIELKYEYLLALCKDQHWEIVSSLLDRGVNLNPDNQSVRATPLFYAVLNENEIIWKRMIAAGANVEQTLAYARRIFHLQVALTLTNYTR